MQTFTASKAKKNFGALLSQLAHSPVAIARHNKTVVVVMIPATALTLPDSRLQARELQQREQQRLMRHQQVAIGLLCATPAKRAEVLNSPERRCPLASVVGTAMNIDNRCTCCWPRTSSAATATRCPSPPTTWSLWTPPYASWHAVSHATWAG